MKKRSFITISVLSAIALLICFGCDQSQAGSGKIDSPQRLMVPPLAADDSTIVIIWEKPEDYSNVVSYNVYQEGSMVGNTTKLFYIAQELIEPGLPYSFWVTAVDAKGNESEPSNKVIAKALPEMEVFDVTKFGAVGDGKTLDTRAIQQAINACTKGGKVLLPKGKTFLSGAIFLKDDMTLQIDGTLLGSDDAADYPRASTRFPYYKSGNNFMGLINAYTLHYGSLQNIRICGSGTVNGSSDEVGSITGHGITKLATNEVAASYGDDSDRADLITIKGVDGLYVGGIKLVNPAMHTLIISYSKNIAINGINVDTYDIHNADGVNICTSDTAYIFNSVFDCGDDAINFNAGVGEGGVKDGYATKNVRVFNCVAKRGHGGAVWGSFTAGWFENFIVEDCVFDGTDRGLRFKTGLKQGGGAKNILCRDIEMKNIIKDAIFFDSTYGSSYPSAGPGQFKDITVKNITCKDTKRYGIYINGTEGAEHARISLSNIVIDNAEKGGAYLKHCKDISFDNVTFKNCDSVWTIDPNTAVGIKYNKVDPMP
ncbi:MAG: glycoside hydrolase family 28 protein [Sedimentisphaerales bacterium]|nr:glycoside hydrolase family 28 protein [Sedimentisphaerales bacterium]